MKEFNSYKPVILPSIGDSQAQTDIGNKAQFNFEAFVQEIIAGKDLKTAFFELNVKWKEARQAL